jgi:hypothetical protein
MALEMGLSATDRRTGAVSYVQDVDRVVFHGEQDPISVATSAVEKLPHDSLAEVVSRDRASRGHFAQSAHGLAEAFEPPGSGDGRLLGNPGDGVRNFSLSAPGRTMTR